VNLLQQWNLQNLGRFDMFSIRSALSVAWVILLVSVGNCAAQSVSENTGHDFFESKIRPMLIKHCYECHSDDAGKARGGLKVDSAAALRQGGDNGPAIVPGNPSSSLLFQAVLYSDESKQMPPEGKLPNSAIEDLRQWIKHGASDPRQGKAPSQARSSINIEQGKQYWAYQPVRLPSLPVDDDWSRTDIDRFIVRERARSNLAPAADADARTLIRRLYLVLTGLPPSPDDLRRWMARINPAGNIASSSGSTSNDMDQDALMRLVDQLLDQPQYGEHWGRHWMDVVRFAESTGGDQNNTHLQAWRYRDWIIDAFNSNMPYDQFVRAQIAGDLLPIAGDQEWADNIIATGFLAIGLKLVGEEDQQKYLADLVDEQIDATTRAFLATSVACARCHDHKFDPIPQSDYYALASIFRSTETHYGLLKAQARQATTLIDLTGLGPPAAESMLDAEAYADLIKRRDDARKAVDDAMKKIRSGESVFRGTLRRIRSQRDETEAALQAYLPGGQPRVFAMGVQDRQFHLPTHVLVRGELESPAALVKPGFLQVLSPEGRSSIEKWRSDPVVRFEKSRLGMGGTGYHSISGRLELAQWISSRNNPLTARVMVNRIWYWMFGQGLVRTTDDFGFAGTRPSHPELLDLLATRFMESGWSTKSLIRQIARSRTWQLSSAYSDAQYEVDPDNHLLWRMNPRRLEAESVRDAMLAVSGKLALGRPLGTLLTQAGEGNVGQNVFEPVIRELDWDHRSVYLPRVRGLLPEMLELFDAPDASLVSGTRAATSSPLQSLYLLNSAWVHDVASAMADLLAQSPADKRIEVVYELCYGRQPSRREYELAKQFIGDHALSALDAEEKLVAYCQTLLCTSEFILIE